MKARPFLAVLLSLALGLLGLGGGAWWLVLNRSPLQLRQRPLAVPLAARFVPRQAPLGLFLLTDGEEPLGYARAVAAPRQRRAASEALAQLRDGTFAAAGLDYPSELASWLGPEIGLALIGPGQGEGNADGWLLSLRSRDGDGARRFLQRFWQSRSLAGTDLQISSYRGMGLISGRGALVGARTTSSPTSLATALIDDDLVLIASGRGVLEQALDVSQIDALNLASSEAFRRGVADLGRGMALLVARPAALAPWLGIPEDLGSEAGITGLIASLRPDGAGLAVDLAVTMAPRESPAPPESPEPPGAPAGADLGADSGGDPEPGGEVESDRKAEPGGAVESDGVAESSGVAPGPPGSPVASSPDLESGLDPDLDPDRGEELLVHLRGEASSLALVNDPRQLMGLLQPWLARILGPASGPLPGLVMAADAGPLLWAEGRDGWLLGTGAQEPAPAALEPALAAQGLIAAPLTLANGRPLTVWTHLSFPVSGRRGAGDGRQLRADLVGVRAVEADLAWWAHGLDRLRQQGESRQQPRGRLRQLQAIDRLAIDRFAVDRPGIDRPAIAARLAVDGQRARWMLRQWSGWRLLSGLAGGAPMEEAVQGFSLALAPGADGLRLTARLDLG
jgi:hypothetical protein